MLTSNGLHTQTFAEQIISRKENTKRWLGHSHQLKYMVKDGAIMSETERARLERDIVNKRRELKRDSDEFREDVNFRRNEEFGKIQRDIVEAIREVAKAQKYDLVLGEGVIYASPAVDITAAITKHLKK